MEVIAENTVASLRWGLSPEKPFRVQENSHSCRMPAVLTLSVEIGTVNFTGLRDRQTLDGLVEP